MDGRNDMGDDELIDTVLIAADQDASLSDTAKDLILAALDSDSALMAALTGVSVPARPPAPPSQTPPEPVGAFLTSIEVRGFRGIGPAATLPLSSKPGLTVVSGRNGSGKSSFAEALEVALTGDSYRWREARSSKTAGWTAHWRNIHTGSGASIRIGIAEEGSGPRTIGVDWTDSAELDARTTWVQAAGSKRTPGVASLGWAGPIELYRPILSYNELGHILEGEPSKLYDALAKILGLEQLTDAEDRLATAARRSAEPQAAARSAFTQVRKSLAELGADDRAQRALALLAPRVRDLDAIQKLATGVSAPDGGVRRKLEQLTELEIPAADLVRSVASELTAAARALAELTGEVADAAEKRSDLLRQALDLHGRHGDGACPVCGVGTLDGAWAANVQSELAREDAQVRALADARRRLTAKQRAARDLVDAVSPLVAPPDISLPSFETARAAVERWRAAPADDAALATHLAGIDDLRTATEPLRAEAGAALAARDDAWAPVALELGRWVGLARTAAAGEAQHDEIKAAADWVKANIADLRNARLVPLATRAREIWAELRQESNVDLGAINLQGTRNRRHVDLQAEVDGQEAGALGVMSQGELHALALALFLPRATMPASPFRFVVLDDPVQAMDPAKIDGFVRVLERLAQNRQVIVFSHDDRLRAAVDQLGVDAEVYEVVRGAGSLVAVTKSSDPATRYLADALAFAKDQKVPDDVRRKILPGLCRMALEAAACDLHLARRTRAGVPRLEIEALWDAARSSSDRVTLALHDGDRTRYDRWRSAKSWRSATMGICGSAVHDSLRTDPVAAVRSVESTVRDLKDATR